ncbi:MAG: GNAT family N-acetyltransferase [Myxococcales bacterium]|nr:GNAT family N-acetyltransferase [Myxococcales bacterium]
MSALELAVTVRAMRGSDVAAVVTLADRLVGAGYYDADAVSDMLSRSTVGSVVCSHVAVRSGEIVGFRFSLPPGRWQHGRGRGLSPELWPIELDACGYFQTAYVDPVVQRQGVGRAMATAALGNLQRLGARGVVTHCWKESPNNSSFRYLSRLGFEPVREFADYWVDVDYDCVRDGRPCHCTAIEMFLALTGSTGSQEAES